MNSRLKLLLAIAERRKAQDLTQQQHAERLGVSQQTLAHYEVGRLRIAVAMLSTLAKELDFAVDNLLGEPAKAGKNKRGPTPKLQQQLKQLPPRVAPTVAAF